MKEKIMKAVKCLGIHVKLGKTSTLQVTKHYWGTLKEDLNKWNNMPWLWLTAIQNPHANFPQIYQQILYNPN